jgi:signal transduction histidine kinase
MRKLTEYNNSMKRTTPSSDAVRLIRFAAILWIGYLIILAIINQIILAIMNQALGPPVPVRSDILYYILLGFVALLCLGLTYWSRLQEWLSRTFIPVIITIITILPILITWVIVMIFPPAPMLDRQGSVLMLLPFLLVAFLLVAWQYGNKYMLLFILGITALNIGLEIAGLNIRTIWSFAPPGQLPFRGPFNVTLIQAVVLLAVGFSISFLMNRLRNQQQTLEAANIRLTHYASTLEQLATSQERNRLARELHDTLAHTMSGLSVQLEAVKAYWDVDQPMARSILDKSLAAIHSGLQETRRALKALRASPLDDLGLAPAISTMAKEAVADANLALKLFIMDKMPALSPDVEQCVYRVAQEAITNVVNHANAKKLTVKLEFIEKKVKLTVRDDGVGFDKKRSNETSHFGLVGMRERANLIGGELNIISKPGHGTTIRLTI